MSFSAASTPNIGPGERRKRLLSGLTLLATSVLIAAVMMGSRIHRGWRVALFLPLWGAALGLFQAQDST